MIVKQLSGKAHLWLGLASGLVVFVVSMTGCLYVFEEEIRNTTQASYRFVEAKPTPRLGVADLRKIAETQFAGEPLRQIRLFADPTKTVQIRAGKDKAERIAFVNPYTGAVLALRPRLDWLGVVEELHTSLLLGEVGRWLIKANILIFLVLLISGLVLWFPGKKARRKQAFRVKWGASPKRVNYDVHSTFGFYASLGLLVITLTGMWWSFDWMKRSVYFLTGSKFEKPRKTETTPVSQAALFPIEKLYASVQARYPGAQEVQLNFPPKPGERMKIRLLYPYDWYRKYNQFGFNAQSGKLLKAELHANYSAGDKVKLSNYDLHTGRMFGLLGKILAFFASLFAASLPITGFVVWWNKRKKARAVHRSGVPAANRNPALAEARRPVRKRALPKPAVLP